MRFDEILKSVRKELNITQEKLAHDLNVSFSTLNRWENGHNLPSRLARLRIRDYCIEKSVSGKTLSSIEVN